MSGTNGNGTRKQLGIFLLALISAGGASQTSPGRRLVCSAQHFLNYYQAVERANDRAGFVDRVALSLVLTSADCQTAKQKEPASL